MTYQINTVAQFKEALFEEIEFYISADDPVRHDLAAFSEHVSDYASVHRALTNPRAVPGPRTRKAWLAELQSI